MPKFIEPYLGLIKILLILAVLGLLAYGFDKATDHYIQVGYDRAELKYQAREANAIQANAARETMINKHWQEAINHENDRYLALRADYDRLRAAEYGLRGTVATLRTRLATASESAARATADATAELLGHCAEQYRRVAEAADGHASDARTCRAAWPVNAD